MISGSRPQKPVRSHFKKRNALGDGENGNKKETSPVDKTKRAAINLVQAKISYVVPRSFGSIKLREHWLSN